MPLPTATFFPTHFSEHNTYYVSPELNTQHNLNQQAHNTTNNIEWNQPLTPCNLLQCWTPHAAVHNLHSWRWTYRCPKHVELFKIINHNFCIKLVPLVIFIYDARSHIHQIRVHINVFLSWLVLFSSCVAFRIAATSKIYNICVLLHSCKVA